MRFDILTLFPEVCRAYCEESILGRAQRAGKLEIMVHNIRDYTKDKHGRVDDYPYGGGNGMVMQPQPVLDCIRAVRGERAAKVCYLSPKGERFSQQTAAQLSQMSDLILLCGHSEGIDQRILDSEVDFELSLGDFVLTGGELPALAVVDAVARLLPGVLAADACYEEESLQGGLLEYPQYTRPPVYEGMEVPDILLSGDHAKIARWRRNEALRITKERRPDLLKTAELDREDLRALENL